MAGQSHRAYVVLNDRAAAREFTFHLEPLENRLRRVPLPGRSLLVVVKDDVDYAQPRPDLWPRDWLLPLVAGRHRVLQRERSRATA